MAPLPINNAFSVARSPTQSTASELTLNATSVPVVNQFMNRSKINANEVSIQDSTEKAKEGGVNEQGVQKNQRRMGVAGSVNSRSKSAKSSSQVVNDPDSTVGRENNSRSGATISVTASHSLKKKILIDSLKDKNCTVASVLKTLMKSSKEVIDEVKFSELQS